MRCGYCQEETKEGAERCGRCLAPLSAPSASETAGSTRGVVTDVVGVVVTFVGSAALAGVVGNEAHRLYRERRLEAGRRRSASIDRREAVEWALWAIESGYGDDAAFTSRPRYLVSGFEHDRRSGNWTVRLVFENGVEFGVTMEVPERGVPLINVVTATDLLVQLHVDGVREVRSRPLGRFARVVGRSGFGKQR